MKKCIFILLSIFSFVSCSKDDETIASSPLEPAKRTVIVYMAGENNLESYDCLKRDIEEMKIGRKLVAESENLVVFVDKANAIERPFLARVTIDNKLDTLYRYQEDFYSSDPEKFADVLTKAVTLCPATEDYGLVLWGHANGWIIENDSIEVKRAYGLDTGDNTPQYKGMWLNIPTMREALGKTPVAKWRFIFFDCCNMMSVETAYELRNSADYLIGSPAEIPANGAPYNTIVPDLFLRTQDFYKNIIDDYAVCYAGNIPLSVVNTSMLEQLAMATKKHLSKVKQSAAASNWNDYIYYYNDFNNWNRVHLMYDIKEVVSKAQADDKSSYEQWLSTLEATIPYHHLAKSWATNLTIAIKFTDFTVTEDVFSGLSIFVPMEKYQNLAGNYNENIKKLAWYYACGW